MIYKFYFGPLDFLLLVFSTQLVLPVVTSFPSIQMLLIVARHSEGLIELPDSAPKFCVNIMNIRIESKYDIICSKIQIVLSVLWGPNGRAGCGGGTWRARFGTWSLGLGGSWREESEPAVGTALPNRSLLSLSRRLFNFLDALASLAFKLSVSK